MLSNQRGIAVFEVIPILVIFVLLLNFAMGFFGVIHSGILNSVAARNYTFETLRNRANLNYLRDTLKSDRVTYGKTGFRFHGTVGENREKKDEEKFVATKRNIKFSDKRGPSGEFGTAHVTKAIQVTDGQKASDIITEPEEFESVWIRTVYGICLNNSCGD